MQFGTYIAREETGMLLRCRPAITCNIYADELRPLASYILYTIGSIGHDETRY